MAKKPQTIGTSTGDSTGGGTIAPCTSGSSAPNERERALQAILHVAQYYPAASKVLPSVFCAALQNENLWPAPGQNTIMGISMGGGSGDGGTGNGGSSCYSGLTITQALRKALKTHFESWAGYARSTPSAMRAGAVSAQEVAWQQFGHIYAARV